MFRSTYRRFQHLPSVLFECRRRLRNIYDDSAALEVTYMSNCRDRTIIPFFTFCAVSVCMVGYCSNQAFSQSWNSNSFHIVVQGHQSPNCNPASGDGVNLVRCSLKVHISGEQKNPVEKDFVLPWETASVEEVVAVAPDSVVFVGEMLNGFHQVSIYSIVSSKIIFKQLAYKVSLSPRQDLIAYQTYQPPHGGQTPFVEIEIVSIRDLVVGHPLEQRTIFGPNPNPESRKVPQDQGQSLCSETMFWSKNEQWIAFCTVDQSETSEKIILASAQKESASVLVKQMDINGLCDQMNQARSVRCTLFIKQIDIDSASVDLVLRSMGSKGYQEGQVKYPLHAFNKVTEGKASSVQ